MPTISFHAKVAENPFRVNVRQGSNYSDSKAARTQTEILLGERQGTENGHYEKIVHSGHRKYLKSQK